jgi:hypothetical protein
MVSLMVVTGISIGWLAAGLALAWIIGGAARLGGPDDPRGRRTEPPLPDGQALVPPPQQEAANLEARAR